MVLSDTYTVSSGAVESNISYYVIFIVVNDSQFYYCVTSKCIQNTYFYNKWNKKLI